MAACFLMDGNPVGPGVGEVGNVLVGILNHQVAVENGGGGLAERLHDGRAERDVGHEVAVHDIDVDDRASTSDGTLHLIGKVGEVGGEDGGR